MKTLVVAKVVLLNPAGQILILQRSDIDVRRPGEWDVPGGHVDDHEFAEEAAARETREEAGIAVVSRDLQLVYAMTEPVADDVSVTWVFYLARTDKFEVVLSHEHIASKWVTIDEALAGFIVYDRQKRMLRYL